MTHFYRYVRPIGADVKRSEMQTLPHGGVCLRFDFNEKYPDGYTFSHARCHSQELFSKAVARRLVDERAEQMAKLSFKDFPKVSVTMDADQLVHNVVLESLLWDPEVKGASVAFIEYFKLELRELASSLIELLAIRSSEHAKIETWNDIISATKFRDQYANLNTGR